MRKYSGSKIREQRNELDASIPLISALSGVNESTLSRWENDLIEPPDAVVRLVLTAFTNLQMVRDAYEGIPLDMKAVKWLRAQIAKLNEGKDIAAAKAGGYARDDESDDEDASKKSKAAGTHK